MNSLLMLRNTNNIDQLYKIAQKSHVRHPLYFYLLVGANLVQSRTK
jgi:hypothetical protein